MIHWYAMDGVNPVRGVSEFAQAVNPLIDIHDLIKVTTKTGKLHGAMALLVKRAAKVGGQGADRRDPPPRPPAAGLDARAATRQARTDRTRPPQGADARRRARAGERVQRAGRSCTSTTRMT